MKTLSILNSIGVLLLLEDGRGTRHLLKQNVSLDEPRKPLGRFVSEVILCWNREDLWWKMLVGGYRVK
jgi:hypothetical protein